MPLLAAPQGLSPPPFLGLPYLFVQAGKQCSALRSFGLRLSIKLPLVTFELVLPVRPAPLDVASAPPDVHDGIT